MRKAPSFGSSMRPSAVSQGAVQTGCRHFFWAIFGLTSRREKCTKDTAAAWREGIPGTMSFCPIDTSFRRISSCRNSEM